MTKKKKGKKSKPAVKKPAKKKSSSRRKKEKETAEVRKDLTRMVKEFAGDMTAAVIGEGKKGQVSPVKFLLEMAGIFPVSEEEIKAPTKDEESLAETLLNRLGIPKDPVAADVCEKDEEIVLLPAKQVGSGTDRSIEESSEVHEVSVE